MARTSTAAETEIRDLFDRWADAIRAKDVGKSLENYATNVVLFDLINPLEYRGVDALRKRLGAWFSSFDGSIGYELRDLTVTSGERVAFSHSLNHVTGTTTDGRALDMWWRATLCLRNLDGEWLVTHSHTSVPFDMKSQKASLDLQP